MKDDHETICKKKVLLIGSGNLLGANGNCVKNVANEFDRRGYKVYVIATSCNDLTKYENDNICLSQINESLFEKLLNNKENRRFVQWFFAFINLIRRILILPFYPNVSPINSVKVYKNARRLINTEKIKVVVSFYRPYEAIYASKRIKQKFSDIKVFVFHLDLLTSPKIAFNFAKPLLVKRFREAFDDELDIVDRVIVPESVDHAQIVGTHNIEKLALSGFPVCSINEPRIMPDFMYDKTMLNVVYIGSLDKMNRDPTIALKVLNKVNESREGRVQLHIWGKVDDYIVKQISNYQYINYHGSIDHKYTPWLLENADCFLNISNYITFNMLPSKIFQYFEFDKPILNFVKNIEDCSLNYFVRMSNALNIMEDNIEDSIINDINNYLESFSNEQKKEKDLYMYTPAYFVGLIERDIFDEHIESNEL